MELNCFFSIILSLMQASICCGFEHSNWPYNSCGSYAKPNRRFGNAERSVTSEPLQEYDRLVLAFKAQILISKSGLNNIFSKRDLPSIGVFFSDKFQENISFTSARVYGLAKELFMK
jgi:hypothetical protein